MPLAYRAVRGGLGVAVSSYFNVSFGFLANPLLTRLLVPEHFGYFVLPGLHLIKNGRKNGNREP
jgi:O-antigen/teichoic acid export membrane protein